MIADRGPRRGTLARFERRVAPWLRRLITRLLAVVPAMLVITIMGESATGDMLVFSQVLLSMQLGFAIVPLLIYVSDKKRMGAFAIGRWAKLAGWLSAAIIVRIPAEKPSGPACRARSECIPRRTRPTGPGADGA